MASQHPRPENLELADSTAAWEGVAERVVKKDGGNAAPEKPASVLKSDKEGGEYHAMQQQQGISSSSSPAAARVSEEAARLQTLLDQKMYVVVDLVRVKRGAGGTAEAAAKRENGGVGVVSDRGGKRGVGDEEAKEGEWEMVEKVEMAEKGDKGLDDGEEWVAESEGMVKTRWTDLGLK